MKSVYFLQIIDAFVESGLISDDRTLFAEIAVDLGADRGPWDIYVPMRHVCDSIRKIISDRDASEKMIKLICELVGYDGKIIF